MLPSTNNVPRRRFLGGLPALSLGAALVGAVVIAAIWLSVPRVPARSDIRYLPRQVPDTSGFGLILANLEPWPARASLEELNRYWDRVGYRQMERFDHDLAQEKSFNEAAVAFVLKKAMALHYEGEPAKAYELLEQTRSRMGDNNRLAAMFLYTVIYYQGMSALRRGETDNCVHCLGESACILPISPAAVHTNREGSSLAVKHFLEYLHQFPDDLEVRWLLNVAHMTLGDYPQGVDQRFLVPLDHYVHSEFDIGKFRDISHQVGLGNRLNQAGGAIMEDFDNDGLLDLVVSTKDSTQALAYYRNKGDGTFEERTAAAGLSKQFGGHNCVQTDYNNDGFMDIWVCHGAWLPFPERPSLLRNNGDGTFTDVTREAGLLDPVNSISASWADYDNDGFLDLFICCENQLNRLYHNKGDGTFEEVAARAGVQGKKINSKGAAWIDYDNDGFPDLFVNNLDGAAQLFHNNRDGTFTDVTAAMNITGPIKGFSCWAWDYDNDGWLDIFATSYDHSLEDVVKGLVDQPHRRHTCKLFRNLQGKGFQDVTKEVGLDKVYATMGSNFGDFDNDGFLDIYLGTGDPQLSMLIPNRMFKNVAGKRFAEISASSGTGHLQKGHGVACGDWDRDGNVDLFMEMGGATNGDRYHNVLFQNPGHSNHWLTVKLVGQKTNRAAIGARIKVVTAGQQPLTVHRHVSSGSSFGANPLQQTIGLGQAERVASLEIYWPTSGTTQVFHDVAVDQAIEATELSTEYRPLNWKPIRWEKLIAADPGPKGEDRLHTCQNGG
jgi:hypothetical protein